MSGQQPTIYTIHESQLNNGAGGSGGRNSNSDLLIDTSSIPMTQQPMPPMQHQHLQPQQASFNANDTTITSQPIGGSSSTARSSRVAPENQNVVFSVHPTFERMFANHDTLLIRQKADCTHTLCGFEDDNTYTVRSKDGIAILKATETSSCCERCCFETNRRYCLKLMDGEEVVARIRKPYRVSRFCCYSNALSIESPEDNPVGTIKQMFTFFGHPRYAIYDCQQTPNTPSFYIEPVSCRFCCTPLLCTCICGNKEFKIISVEHREEVGTIMRHWHDNAPPTIENTETGEEPFGTDRDSGANSGQMFGIQFSPNLENRHKVLLLSACFMMDFFYFENDRRRRKLASC